MHKIFLGLISIMLGFSALAATNSVEQAPKDADELGITNSPGEQELEKIMMDDDNAMDEVDQWIQENNAFKAQGAGESKDELNRRILARLDTVRTNYEDFLRRYPTNADAYLAYGSFLDDIGEEENAYTQYEKSRRLNPNNPAAWNDLANFFGENGPITNAFIYYTKAIELNPNEPVYYENFATTVYLYRKDVMEYYHINEAQVFDKALALYQKAIHLDPNNFQLMTDYAESYYGIKPLRTNDALVAWTNALNIAQNDLEREAVYVHLARIKIAAGYYDEAQAHLDAVTNSAFDVLKDRLEKTMAERKKGMRSFYDPIPTNQPTTGTHAAPAATNTTSMPASSSGQKTP